MDQVPPANKDHTYPELTIAQLGRKIDEQARFTRSVVVICTLSILALMCYTLTEMNSTLPKVMLMELQGNLEKIVLEWREVDKNISFRQQQGKPGLTGPMR
jgi:hypothetical protein